MARRKKNKLSNALSYVLVVLLIVGVCGFVVFFTNGLTEDFKEFFLIINDKPVLSDISGVNIAYNEPLSIQVRYTFDGIKKDLSGYKVTITANPDTDYSFTVDGKEVKLSVGHQFEENVHFGPFALIFPFNLCHFYRVPL